jgi:hypothetical protein
VPNILADVLVYGVVLGKEFSQEVHFVPPNINYFCRAVRNESRHAVTLLLLAGNARMFIISGKVEKVLLLAADIRMFIILRQNIHRKIYS